MSLGILVLVREACRNFQCSRCCSRTGVWWERTTVRPVRDAQEFLSDLRSKIPCLQMAVGSAWEVESMDLPNACVLQLVVEAGFAQLATHTNAVEPQLKTTV